MLIFAAVSASWVVGSLPWDPDESRYLEMGREMASSHDWLIPTLNGVPYLEKPPLYIWLVAAAFRVFGTSVIVGKLVSAITAGVTIFATAWIARLWLGPGGGLRAGIVLATCPLFLALGSLATVDLLLVMWILAGIAVFLQAMSLTGQSAGGPGVLFGYLFFSLAVLTKGPVALVVPGLAWVLWRGPRQLIPPRPIAGSLVFLLAAAPWFIAVQRRVPEFFEFFFLRGHLGRMLGEEAELINFHAEPWHFYLPILIGGAAPWIIHLAAPWSVLRGELAAGSWGRLFWGWIGGPFVFFSAVAGKLPTYVLPLFPALSILVAKRWKDADEGTVSRRWLAGSTGAAAAACVAAAATGLVLLTRKSDAWWQPLVEIRLAACVAGAAIAGLLAACVLAVRDRMRPAFGAMAAGMAATLMLAGPIKTALDRGASSQPLVEALQGVKQADDAVVCVHKYLPLFSFLLGEPVLVAGSRGELAFGSEALGARPDLFLDLSELKALVTGPRRVFLAISSRRVKRLEERLGTPLFDLERSASTTLLSNRAAPWSRKAP